jgi:6,7-dimethyl-8-ribityllumazine synthase
VSDRPHVLIVEARFYEDIADELSKGAIAALETAGATFDRIEVPGAFEVPAAIAFAAERKDGPRYDAFIGLGCVIRGETTHYDYVCGESARGMMDLSLKQGLALGYGILTVENREQAWIRASAGENGKNKGRDVAEAALRMHELKKRFGAA